jgi:toxin ParE1/3/4
VAEHDTPGKANHVLQQLVTVCGELAEFPERGPHPPELLQLGIRDYRQVFIKLYRLIYRVSGRRVYIHLITDGRRDMQSLLARRLLSG